MVVWELWERKGREGRGKKCLELSKGREGEEGKAVGTEGSYLRQLWCSTAWRGKRGVIHVRAYYEVNFTAPPVAGGKPAR